MPKFAVEQQQSNKKDLAARISLSLTITSFSEDTVGLCETSRLIVIVAWINVQGLDRAGDAMFIGRFVALAIRVHLCATSK
jgi:hypothetical protein